MSHQEDNLREFCTRLLTELQNRSGVDDAVTRNLLSQARALGFNDDFENERADKPGPTVHVVTRMVGGYAREDVSTAGVLGAYTDPALARRVASLWGPDSRPHVVDINVIPQGIVNMAAELKLDLMS